MIKSNVRSPQSIVFLFSILIIVSSCKHNAYRDSLGDASPYFTNFFTGNEETVLRDVNFNISADELKKTEKSSLYESTPDHLFYEFSYPKDSTAFSEYANVHYFFNEENQLDIITADIYLNDSVQVIKLMNTINEYYDLRFGNTEKDSDGRNIWKGTYSDTRTGKDYNYSVSLKETTGDFGVSIEYVRE